MKSFIPLAIVGAGVILAVCGAAKLPDDGQNWPTTWPLTLVGVVLVMVGNVGWRRAQTQAASAPRQTSTTTPLNVIDDLRRPLHQLAAEAPRLNAGELESRIDQLIEQYVLPVGGSRQRLVAELGVSRAAEILIDFSAVERNLNRAWSAAGDGNLEEAVASVRRAAQGLSTPDS